MRYRRRSPYATHDFWVELMEWIGIGFAKLYEWARAGVANWRDRRRERRAKR